MADSIHSTSPPSKPKEEPILLSDEDLTDDVKARSCCGCFFFLFTLWIWGSVIVGLFMDELATREIKEDVSNRKTTLICGWQARHYKLLDGTRKIDNYAAGSTAQKAGESYLGCAISMTPFLVLLTVSCCMRTGTKDEKPEESFGPHDDKRKQNWDRYQKCCNNLNRAFKIIGMLGTFILSIAAYASFSNAINDCSSNLSGTTSAGNPTTGRTLLLLISAVVIASILILVVVVLIVLLTSENTEQLTFVGAIVTTMSCFGCDQGCPECNGGLDCADAGAEPDELCGAVQGCCCCCCNGA